MFSKRNIAIYFGLLLALMSVCVSTAVAAEGGGDEGYSSLEMVVSPDNLVIETNSKYISVVIEDTDDTNNTPSSSIYLDPESMVLTIDVFKGTDLVDSGTFGWTRYEEGNDEDEDDLLALVLMYERANLFESTTPSKRTIEGSLDVSEATLLVFTVEGKYYDDITSFKEAYKVTPMHVVPGGKSKKPADKPETPGNGPGGKGK